MTSGQYDRALALASRRSLTFRSLLSDYRGPIPISQGDVVHAALINPTAYRFTNFAPPFYPPLAKMARIEGKVELQLTVNPVTGAVESVSATSGHALLKPSALEAAKRWRFEPLSVPSGQISATLLYFLNCP